MQVTHKQRGICLLLGYRMQDIYGETKPQYWIQAENGQKYWVDAYELLEKINVSVLVVQTLGTTLESQH